MRPPLQERLRGLGAAEDYGWRVLMACVLCTRTRGADAAATAEALAWAGPGAVERMRAGALAKRLRPLGLHERRARTLRDLSAAWNRGDRNPHLMPGCGPYAANAYLIFVDGRRDLAPDDRVLAAWLDHLNETNENGDTTMSTETKTAEATAAELMPASTEEAESAAEKPAKKPAAKKATKKPAAAKKVTPGRKSAARGRYPAEITDAVKRAKRARGTTHGAPGAKQHVLVREEIAGLDPRGILDAAGVKTERALRALADGSSPRDDLKALRPLAAKFDDPFCKGRNLASILVAALEQAKGPAAKK